MTFASPSNRAPTISVVCSHCESPQHKSEDCPELKLKKFQEERTQVTQPGQYANYAHIGSNSYAHQEESDSSGSEYGMMAQEEVPKNDQTILIIGTYFPNNEEEHIPELKLQNRSVAEWTEAVQTKVVKKRGSEFSAPEEKTADTSGVSPPQTNSRKERIWGRQEEQPSKVQRTEEYGCAAVSQKRRSRAIWTKDQVEREIWKDVLRDTAQFVNSHDHRHGCQAEALMGKFQEVGVEIGRDLIEGYWNIRTPIKSSSLHGLPTQCSSLSCNE
jgi:hypothetical protein